MLGWEHSSRHINGLRGDILEDGEEMLGYQRPESVDEALAGFQRASGNACLFAGGTDLLPRWSKGALPRPDSVVDLKAIPELRGISRVNGEVWIGACTPLSALEMDPTVRSAAPLLAEAAGRVACPQVRNRATIGGNLCNASPAADTALPLLLLDAVVELAAYSPEGGKTREVLIGEFFRGPGSTVLAPGEILTGIRFQPLPEGVFAVWDKFGTRPAMEIAVASVGVTLEIDSRTMVRTRVAYGSVAPVPLRGYGAEKKLIGNRLWAGVIDKCVAAARAEIAPITDVRASETYRRDVVEVLLRRMLERAERTVDG